MAEVHALAQSSETPTELLQSGHGQLAAARAVLLDFDPRVRALAAREHLISAWSSLAAIYGVSLPELRARLGADERREALPGIDSLTPAASARAGAVLEALQGGAEGARALDRDALLEHVRLLGRLYAAVDRARTGGSFARAQARRNWGVLVLLAIAALVVSALVVATRAPADEGPWRAALYRSKVIAGEPAARRRDRDIDFDWGLDSPLGDAMPVDFFAVRWDTCMVLEDTTTIEFNLISDDGARLLVGSDRVVNNWGNHRARQARGARVLEPGVHHLQLLYYDHRGPAQVHLTATVDGGAIGPVPRELLVDPGSAYELRDPCARVREARAPKRETVTPATADDPATPRAAGGASSTRASGSPAGARDRLSGP